MTNIFNINVTHLCLLVISFSLIINTDQILGAEEPDAVRDLDGNKLRAGTDYYILSVIRGAGGGGVKLGSTGKEKCPLDVVQAQLDLDRGLPVTFTPVNPKKGVIRESTDLNIKFSVAPTCVQTTLWKLDHQSSDGQYFITTGGQEGNPGSETISNWFKIEKVLSDFYKLVYCPTVCDHCKVICKDIGIYFEDGKRRLALSDAPFRVMFQKAGASDFISNNK